MNLFLPRIRNEKNIKNGPDTYAVPRLQKMKACAKDEQGAGKRGIILNDGDTKLRDDFPPPCGDTYLLNTR